MSISQKITAVSRYNVVMKDEREAGLRETLNLGHTVGRAIETVSDYKLLAWRGTGDWNGSTGTHVSTPWLYVRGSRQSV